MNDEIKLDDYAACLWRAKWIIIIVVLAAGGATAIYRRRQPVAYSAQALVQVGRVWNEELEDPYVTSETVNGDGFLHDLAKHLNLKPHHIRQAIRASTITGGPQRNSHPILVRIVATTSSYEESITLARSTADQVVALHDSLFTEALAPHVNYQHTLEAMLGKPHGAAGEGPAVSDPLPASQQPPIEAAIQIQRDLADVESKNTSPTATEKTHIVGSIVPGAEIKPDVVRPAALAAFTALLVAMAAALFISYSYPLRRPATPRPAESEMSSSSESHPDATNS